MKKSSQEHFSGFTLMIHLLSLVCFKLFSVACFVQNITFIIFEETQAQVQFQHNERKIITVRNNYK